MSECVCGGGSFGEAGATYREYVCVCAWGSFMEASRESHNSSLLSVEPQWSPGKPGTVSQPISHQNSGSDQAPVEPPTQLLAAVK